MEYNFEGKTWEDLRNEVQRLNNVAMWTEKVVKDLQNTKDIVAEVIERLITDGTITDSEDIETLCKALGLDIEREVEFEFTATITGTIKVPYGETPDEYGFEIEGILYNLDSPEDYDVDINSVNFSE